MFFGAGNLIFPPTLGQESGDLWAWGLVGFLLVDAVLSCLGVFVVSRLGGPRAAFDGALGKIGGTILTAVAIVCLCVVFAMPRTAATTFELSVAPYLGEGANSFLVPFFYPVLRGRLSAHVQEVARCRHHRQVLHADAADRRARVDRGRDRKPSRRNTAGANRPRIPRRHPRGLSNHGCSRSRCVFYHHLRSC